jgi:hypothetical protein
MPWITDDELAAALKGAIGLDADAALPSSLAAVVPWANRDAYYRVRAHLMGRGYTADQLDAWEGRAAWNERLGVCAAVKRAGFRGEGYDTQAAAEDCRDAVEELKELAVVVGGEAADPAAGRITSGGYDTGDDIHTIGDTL